jgi:hypothetical protein
MLKQTLPAFIRYSNVFVICGTAGLTNNDLYIRLETFFLRPRPTFDNSSTKRENVRRVEVVRNKVNIWSMAELYPVMAIFFPA